MTTTHFTQLKTSLFSTKTVFSVAFSVFLLLMTFQMQGQERFNLKLHKQSNLDFLQSLNQNAALNPTQMAQARTAMLYMNNEARQNTNYRKAAGCKAFLNLPSNLKPLVLDERLNRLAQEQAEYQARTLSCTHDNTDYPDLSARVNAHIPNSIFLEGCAQEKDLSLYPIVWMQSETHHRPTWDLGDKPGDSGAPLNAAGYGVAKGSNGVWYATAVWSHFETPQQPTAVNVPSTNTTPKVEVPKTAPSIATLPLQKGTEMVLNQRYYTADKKHYLIWQGDGNLVVYRGADDRFVWGSYNNMQIPLYKGKKAVMQTDGNFCFYDANDRYVWGTQTQGEQITVNDAGQLVVNGSSGNQIWPSK